MVFELRLWQAVPSTVSAQEPNFLDSYSLFHVRRSRGLESSCQQFDISVLLTQYRLSQSSTMSKLRALTSIHRDTL
jgi:hypothetical protein